MKEKHEKNTVEAARIPPAPVAEAKAVDQAAFHSCTEIAAIGTACPIAASFLLERG